MCECNRENISFESANIRGAHTLYTHLVYKVLKVARVGSAP